MPRPITPFCGCDVFVVNQQSEVLLIRRSDNGFWALPGGCQNLGESARECAIRECREESGLIVEIEALLGVWSSKCYEYKNYPWKDNEFTHLLFSARSVGGELTTSEETTEAGWFPEAALPELSDGHAPRITFGFGWLRDHSLAPYFE